MASLFVEDLHEAVRTLDVWQMVAAWRLGKTLSHAADDERRRGGGAKIFQRHLALLSSLPRLGRGRHEHLGRAHEHVRQPVARAFLAKPNSHGEDARNAPLAASSARCTGIGSSFTAPSS